MCDLCLYGEAKYNACIIHEVPNNRARKGQWRDVCGVCFVHYCTPYHAAKITK